MQQSSARSEKCDGTSPMRSACSSCTSKSGPLRVTQEAIDAYERQTGFHGIGKIMVEHGVWVIVPRGEVAQANWNNGGCTGAHPAAPAVSFHDRACTDSAAKIQEGAP
jgi:hypothetical protein